MRSIQTKFIALILSCVFLCSAVIGGAGILSAQRVIDGDSAKIMNLLCSEKAQELDALLLRVQQSVKTLAVYTVDQLESVERLSSDPDYLAEYTRRLEDVAVNAADNTEGALAVYVRFDPTITASTAGLFWSRTERNRGFVRLTPTDLSSYASTDTEHVGWYYIPLEKGEAAWMAPYFNDNLGVEMISYVIPLYRDGQTVGVVGMDIDFDVVEQIVKNTRAYDSGRAFLTDDQGHVAYHPELPMGTSVGSADKSLLPAAARMETGSSGDDLFPYAWKGQEMEMAFRTLRNGMRLVVTAPVEEINAARNGLFLQIAAALLAISVLSAALASAMARRLIRPLKELTQAAGKIAEGDLSVAISSQARDEVGELADSFQKTVGHLQEYISYINGLAYRDPLTGVKNKAAYLESVRRMEDRMHTARPEFAVMVLDINGLKQVNDTRGHEEGDRLITAASRLICRVFAHSPVYRIGGDEFVVLLENGDLERCPQLLEDFTQDMKCGGGAGRLSIARGVAFYDSDVDLAFADVFKRADDAMYRNKAAMKAQETALSG